MKQSRNWSRIVATVAALGAVLTVSSALVPVTSADDRHLSLDRDGAVDAGRAAARGEVVTLPAGSTDELEAAIAAAGPRGVVLVEAGDHFENATVVIDIEVSIIGEPGAVILSDTPPLGDTLLTVVPALHVRDTSNVVIQGLELTPLVAGISNAAVLIDNSPRVTIESNTISGYTAGVLVQKGDRADISGNEITLTGAGDGIVIVNGKFAKVTDNVISNALFGIWACDKKGRAARNTTDDSFIGIILCKVPPAVRIGEEGEIFGSELSATQWHVQNNSATGNFWGYAVTDGSANNVLANNVAAASQFVDVEVLGDSEFFGFFTPTATGTVIATGASSDLTIHDCGEGTITNGNLIDAPCF